MTWYDIKWNGQEYVEDLTGAAQKTLTVLGIHGYATEAEARAHPQTMNTLQAVTGGAQALSGVSGSATNIPTPGGVATGAGAATAATGSIDDYLEFPEKTLAWISNRGNIMRIVKVIAGGGMVLLGISMLVNKETNIGSAVATAAKVVK